MRKRTMIIFLATLMMGVAVAGFATGGSEATGSGDVGFNATGFPIVDQQTSLSVFMTQYPEQTVAFSDMTIVQKIQEKTNVVVDWDLAPSQDYQTKVNLMFASNDLPDVFLGGVSVPQAYVYGQQDMVRPLGDLIDEYTVNIQDYLETTQGLRALVTSPDGNIYNLFGFADAYHQDFGNMIYVNRDWLAAVGMDMPTTTEEFRAMLEAFKANDLNGNGVADEIPFGIVFYTRNQNWSDLNFFGSFGLQMDPGANFFAVEDGTIVWEPTLDGFRETISYLNSLYESGLIDQEAYIQDRSQLQAKGQANPIVLGAYTSWFAGNVGGTNGDHYDVMGPLTGPEGYSYSNWHPRASMSGGPGVITSSSEIPEVAIRWLDNLYDVDTNFQLGYGAEGEGTYKDDNGVWRILDPPAGITAELLRMTTSPHHIFKISPDRIQREMPDHFVTKDAAKRDMFLPNAPVDRALPVFYLPAADQEEFDALYADIKTYTDQKWAEWVMNGNIDREWDAFLAQLNRMGLETVLEIQQRGYDNLMNLN